MPGSRGLVYTQSGATIEKKMWLRPVRRNTQAHHQHGPRLETDHAVEERSSAQEESANEAHGGIAGLVVLAEVEALKLKHNSNTGGSDSFGTTASS